MPMKSSSSELEQLAQQTIQESIALQQTLLADESLVRLLARVGTAMATALSKGRKILLFGNGGSAADAQHIAAEFVGRYRMERPSLPAIALTTDTSALTAIGNDYAFEDVFARPLEALGNRGDVAMGFSTSGKSPNVLKAMAAARKKGLVTVGLTGQSGEALVRQVDFCFRVPSVDTPRVQEAHALIGHILCDMVEKLLFARLKKGKLPRSSR
jgi:D-sedoheptulose 7-phosphate isomerase